MKNIIFDCGGVIVKYKFETYLDCFSFDAQVKKDLLSLFRTKEQSEFHKGNISELEFKNFCLNKFPNYKDEINKILSEDSLDLMLPVYDDVVTMIRRLKVKGYKLYLLSDINETTIRYLNRKIDGFENLFDGIVYSCRVHKLKRDGEVFDYILDKYNLDKNETLFIDDSEKNLNQASKRGIMTFKFTDPDVDLFNIKSMIRFK